LAEPRGAPTGSRAPAIRVDDLRKTYFVPEREGGVRAAAGSLFRRKTKAVEAVAGISFEVQPGEIVGFLGPNGAGKTTTLKMLAGLLYPTSGQADALGYTPWQRDDAFLGRMALIMGQRNQLQWDIPVIDSFELNRAIYGVPRPDFQERVDELVELLELGELIRKPVRNLSLGERMKVEIAGSLLHRPDVLFLDEPTIGLDVTMQRRIRGFIGEYNARTGATTLLTSHYMADVEALCKRVIVIHHGKLLFDGDLAGLIARFAPHKTIVVDLEAGAQDPTAALQRAMDESGGHVVEQARERITVQVPRPKTALVTTRLLAELPVVDLVVEEPAVDEVIDRVFAVPKEAADAEAAAAAAETSVAGEPASIPATPR
jgi:ABC-2 type transport system ATP-binding protein